MEKKTILIVDDSGLLRLIVSDELGKMGYNTITAATGEKALKIISSQKPDLILLDVIMPGPNGFEICRQLKSNSATSGIPVIFMTAKDEKQDMISGKQAGGAGYLTKPFEIEELRQCIMKNIRG
jgi:DNA-binding response OmpR family regulator